MLKIKWTKKTPIINYNENDSILEKLAKINGIENLNSFLYPRMKDLHSPYLLKNIDIATDKIINAIKKQQKVGVSIDHDADGITSSAVMIRTLKEYLPEDNIYYIYAQRSAGHGIENQMNQIQDDTDLLIILDSSTSHIKECKILKEDKGIDVVIIDHHDEFKEVNEYATIINPYHPDCEYPNKSISTVALVYKVVQVLDEKIGNDIADDFIDLVGYGLYADMMDIRVPENRYLIMKSLEQPINAGIKAILQVNKVNINKMDSQTIGYTIAPNLNGACRLDKVELAIELMLEDDFDRCLEIAEEIKKLNNKRRYQENKLYKEVKCQINEEDKVIIVKSENSTKGYNGLIANKISNKFDRPCLVLTNVKGDKNKLGGSFRGNGIELKGILEKNKLFNFVAGHSQAGGVGFKTKDLAKIKKFFNNHEEIKKYQPEIKYDLEIGLKNITFELIKEIERFNYITGTGLKPVRFLVEDIKVLERKVMGKNKDTIKYTLEENGVEMIKFKVDEEWHEEVNDYVVVDAIGGLSINQFYNNITKQIVLEDIKINEEKNNLLEKFDDDFDEDEIDEIFG